MARPKKAWLGLVFFLSALGSVIGAQPTVIRLIAGGYERQAILTLPRGGVTAQTPVIIAFHGHGGTMEAAQEKFHCEELWPEALVMYPQGLKCPGGLLDPQGNFPGWQSNLGDQDDRDIAFFDALLEYVQATYKASMGSTYLIGHSNGAVFTYLLWAVRREKLAAICPIAGILPTKIARDSLEPIPCLIVGGRNDRLVRFAWQQDSINFVRKIDGCPREPRETQGKLSVYPSSLDIPFETYIDEGGHEVPEGIMDHIIGFFKAIASLRR